MPKSNSGKVSWPYPTRAPKLVKAPPIYAAVGGKPKAGLKPNLVPKKPASTFRDNDAN